MPSPIHVIGGGLSGAEAAWQIAKAGIPVILHEMRPDRSTPAHHSADLAELVCSNSFRADDAESSAIGILHREMRRLDSLILQAADCNRLPAGGALAVDRQGFAAFVTAAIKASPLITLVRGEVTEIPADWDQIIIATGPLTSETLAAHIKALTGEDDLAFFDAIAPVVYRDSIDMTKAWFQSRYDKVGPGGNGADYINCPLDKEQYQAFVEGLIQGEKISFKEWEGTPYFNGCLPIEIMAERGPETLRHGPMKPVGLTNAHAPTVKPYAIVQLRQDNALGTLYNMVGFQTKLKHAEQIALFRTIPGLEQARFARLGGLHRNIFLNTPKVLDMRLRLKADPRLRFAGQITGCEGYVESAGIGLLVGRMAACERLGESFVPPPTTTALGALLNHITAGHIETIDAGPRSFQPMNVNFGLFPPLTEKIVSPEGKRLRGPEKDQLKKRLLSQRAERDLEAWCTAPTCGPTPLAAE
ncbi:methylenetetrahydrofolate--tRNA-(uracil(54)-C(5))-methyltransferase (FADH(2)-oxidizing) TrmFO [Beijerinckia indica]|uniref:Methylenetetrahydrofolate--tRNA-(uracil-5-)-methyltransferase TrmFO n=1 Tax=Beijerinckia indica subsp. indica (strain ATCC 9039 / DSM 1715 / NCIMB 8712) TaxID=395963 RepID=TRMFO_BEII9|nr:methylenetetrahydrofolate--tRNA-(uracil(54)-C(5))-methyltransferase (FADH(2)-oxidizing) TrmFO [Beijerinckia indica]B2IGU6.1 RecName: Full=Methylenetetrahydrofolate--tRNA-(uracil-5-)-methyltransferase TrmFO; AltName: Full=Folate-dependent tRNA (uracil-5-)-methyltransferase; AltName: Full=Folate-dependent tRNA(M-5-U54)-methyltransferase [Beijerinckia indica subsp. indica ATCC 9039]ACB95860.1 gid protein [Beijerinckia indica subsp. indica ATCC 9039]